MALVVILDKLFQVVWQRLVITRAMRDLSQINHITITLINNYIIIGALMYINLDG